MRPLLLLCIPVLAIAAVACSSSSKSSDKPAANNSPSVQVATTAPSTSSGAAAATATKPAAVGSAATATSGSASSASAAGLDPCKLLTKDDATATLGKPVADGKLNASATSPLGQKTCFYGTDPAGGGSVQLSVITSAGMTDALKKNGQTAKVQFGQEKALFTTGVTAVTGLGDDAFFQGNNLHVLKGDTDISLMLSGIGSNGDATQQTALKSLAAKILPRLP